MTETELALKLERLERDNRRLKGFALGVLALAAVLSTVSVIYSSRHAAQTIKAHEFDVVDRSGKVRVRIAIDQNKAQSGKAPVPIPEGATLGPPLNQGGMDWPTVALFDGQGKRFEEMGGPRAALRFWDPLGRVVVDLSGWTLSDDNTMADGRLALGPYAGWLNVRDLEGNPVTTQGVLLEAAASGQSKLELTDAHGFRMDLGTTETENGVTGESQKTSATSIVMFGNDKDHHVIWKAP
jgi:hypothetical protein